MALLYIAIAGCSEKIPEAKQFVVKNTLNINRSFETLEIEVKDLVQDSTKTYAIIDEVTKEELVSQLIDQDGDGMMDLLLFQPEVKADSERLFSIVLKETATPSEATPNCYSRFVPERTDDYAWENNRVAFRTYGPTAQKMIEDKVPGGTLSSGIDAWLKRVDYPIINNWYKKELETDGSYHEDSGEGLDNFHVGSSRGVGGIAKKVDTTYHISKNFTAWKTISTGPIRTSFVLEYADWDADGNVISEEKKISLDYGSNLSKFEISLQGTNTVSAGLTLHEKDGAIGTNTDQGWVSYWEPHEDSEIGTGIVVPGSKMVGYEHYLTNTTDRSNLFAQIEATNGKITYYAGFGWKKSGQFNSKQEWENYLDQFAHKLKNPLILGYK